MDTLQRLRTIYPDAQKAHSGFIASSPRSLGGHVFIITYKITTVDTPSLFLKSGCYEIHYVDLERNVKVGYTIQFQENETKLKILVSIAALTP